MDGEGVGRGGGADDAAVGVEDVIAAEMGAGEAVVEGLDIDEHPDGFDEAVEAAAVEGGVPEETDAVLTEHIGGRWADEPCGVESVGAEDLEDAFAVAEGLFGKEVEGGEVPVFALVEHEDVVDLFELVPGSVGLLHLGGEAVEEAENAGDHHEDEEPGPDGRVAADAQFHSRPRR